MPTSQPLCDPPRRVAAAVAAAFLSLVLTACGSGLVAPGQGALRASATTPDGPLSFDCDPAAQGGSPVVIADESSFSCPSTDGRAALTILLSRVPAPSGAGSEERLGAVLTRTAPSATVYSGPGQLQGYGRVLNRALSGDFSARLPGNVTLAGSFSFSSP